MEYIKDEFFKNFDDKKYILLYVTHRFTLQASI